MFQHDALPSQATMKALSPSYAATMAHLESQADAESQYCHDRSFVCRHLGLLVTLGLIIAVGCTLALEVTGYKTHLASSPHHWLFWGLLIGGIIGYVSLVMTYIIAALVRRSYYRQLDAA